MKVMISILAVVAVSQVTLAVWAFSGKTQLSEQVASSTLLNFAQEQIDQVSIRGDDSTVELNKKDGKWQTADGYPLEVGKMDSLMDKLAGLKFGLPVATSEAALKRFKVAENDFERHLRLKTSGETVAELYLGTGSGVRKSHLRTAQQEAVYTAEIGSYDLPARVDGWQDKTLLQLPKDEITGVKLGDLSLTLEDSNNDTDKTKLWKADKLPDGKQLDQLAINLALSPFDSLRINKVLGTEAKPEYGMDKPKMTVSLTYKDGERSYQVSKLKDADEYIVKASHRPEYFQLPSFSGKPLVEKIAVDAWVVDVAKPEPETAAGTERETKPVAEVDTAPVGAPEAETPTDIQVQSETEANKTP